MTDVIQVDVQTVAAWHDEDKLVLIDVREPHEYLAKHVPDSIHMPMSAFDPDAIPDVPAGSAMVFMCALGQRSQAVARHCLNAGLIDRACNMTGGIHAWADAGLPIVTD